MMDWKTALATFIIIVLLYVAIQKNKPDANWGSSTQSQTFLSALKSVHNLTKVEEHVKNYRPKVFFININFNAVKPVYNDHLLDPKKDYC